MSAWRRAARRPRPITLAEYRQLEESGAVVRPLSLGPMRKASSPVYSPAATRTSPAERALLRGAT